MSGPDANRIFLILTTGYFRRIGLSGCRSVELFFAKDPARSGSGADRIFTNRIFQGIGLSDYRALDRIFAKDSASPGSVPNRRFADSAQPDISRNRNIRLSTILEEGDQALTTNRIIRFKFEPEYPVVFSAPTATFNVWLYIAPTLLPHLVSSSKH